MKILSFNLSWECMSNSSKGSAGRLGSICKSFNNNKFTCRDNFISYLKKIRIKYDDFDIFCFQEFSNLKNLKYLFDNNFYYYQNKSGLETIVTILNLNKFNVLDIIPGEFKKGRPFTIFNLENKIDLSNILLVNLHFCNFEKCNFTQILTKYLKNKFSNYESIFFNSRIIVIGDFNYHNNPQIINNNNNILTLKPFNNLNSCKLYLPQNSCCFHNNFNEKMKYKADLIFDSSSIASIEVLKPNIPISDHYPIISFLI